MGVLRLQIFHGCILVRMANLFLGEQCQSTELHLSHKHWGAAVLRVFSTGVFYSLSRKNQRKERHVP